jgi:hypothetical protein
MLPVLGPYSVPGVWLCYMISVKMKFHNSNTCNIVAYYSPILNEMSLFYCQKKKRLFSFTTSDADMTAFLLLIMFSLNKG